MPKPVQIRRQQVYDLLRTHAEPLTSKEVARLLQVKEVSVRAAISWLVLGGFLLENGHAFKRTKPNKKGWCVRYKVKLYKCTDQIFDSATCHTATRGIYCARDRELEQTKTKFNADLSFLDTILFGRMKARS